MNTANKYWVIYVDKIKILNLTPHDINIYDPNGERIIKTYERSGIVARVNTVRQYFTKIDGVPVYRISYGNIEGVPKYEPNTYIIVSLIVAQALILINSPWIGHILDPDTSPQGVVRSKEGKILGVKGFQIW